MMMKIFYSIWVDAINYERIKNGGEDHWKAVTFAYMSILLSLNILAILSAVLFITGYELTSNLTELLENLFSNELIVNFLWFLSILLIPSMLINYYFIFHNSKYESLLKKYKFKKGKFLLVYFIVTFIAFFGFSLLNKYY